MVWTAGEPELAGRAELWARRVERALERDGATVTSDPERWAHAPAGFPRARMDRIGSIEVLLFLARSRASELDERGALAALVEAERSAEMALAIPGGAGWYAEVEVQVAITAFQLGQRELASAALERAASIDPRRRIRPAEAPPELVEVAQDVVSSAAAAPISSFEVRAADDVRDARVFVDDEPVGTAPVQVTVRAGAHAVRVEASGHLPWASLLTTLPGTRAPVEVALAPEPAVAAVRMLSHAVRAMELSLVPELLRTISENEVALGELLLVVVGEGVFDRAALVGCTPDGCTVRQLLQGDVPASMERAPARVELAAAEAWLDEIPYVAEALPPSAPWWEEPWPWLILGGVALGAAVGATTGAVLEAEPAPRTIVVTFPDL